VEQFDKEGLGIHPADMSDEQLDAAIALIQRRQPVCSDAEVKWSDDIDAVELRVSSAVARRFLVSGSWTRSTVN
jgi:hypothetical protein